MHSTQPLLKCFLSAFTQPLLHVEVCHLRHKAQMGTGPTVQPMRYRGEVDLHWVQNSLLHVAYYVQMSPQPLLEGSPLSRTLTALRHPSAVHSSTRYYNRCAWVSHPTDLSPQALPRPSPQQVLLSKSKDSRCTRRAPKLTPHPKLLSIQPHSLTNHGLLDPGQESSALTRGLPLPGNQTHRCSFFRIQIALPEI